MIRLYLSFAIVVLIMWIFLINFIKPIGTMIKAFKQNIEDQVSEEDEEDNKDELDF